MDYHSKVLIVHEDIETYNSSIDKWANYGIKSSRVDSIEQALESVSVFVYHLIVIVERKEQRRYVLDSIKLFRELTIAPIVIASTDPIEPDYRITGLDMGADEVWEMPQMIEVAVAKGNAIIRRYLNLFKEIDKQATITVNKDIVLSETQRLVFVKGNKVELPKVEFDILTYLISHPGRVFTHEQIFSEVWGEEFTDTSKEVLRTRICKLRDMLRVEPTFPNYIKTHLKIGYSFSPEYDR